MNKNINETNLRKVIELTFEMQELADQGDNSRSDDGCRIVFGVLRDSAYKIRGFAQKELDNWGNRRIKNGST